MLSSLRFQGPDLRILVSDELFIYNLTASIYISFYGVRYQKSIFTASLRDLPLKYPKMMAASIGLQSMTPDGGWKQGQDV